MHKYVRDKQDITALVEDTQSLDHQPALQVQPAIFSATTNSTRYCGAATTTTTITPTAMYYCFRYIYPCHQQRRRRIRIRRRQRDCCQGDCQGQRRRRQTRTSASTHLSDGDVAQALQALGHVRVPRLEPGRANFERAEVLGPRLLQLAALEPEVPQRRAVKRVL